MPFHFRDYPTLTIPRRGLVPEFVVQDDWSLRRTPNRPRHEMLDFTVQNVIGGQADDILKVLSFQVPIDFRIGKGRIPSKDVPSCLP